MAATMRVVKWKSEGLRCPDHEINCCDASGIPNKITLVQMPNGTGKTTTLSLLRAALSGSAHSEAWDRNRVNEFRKRNDGRPKLGQFEVTLLLNGRRTTITMDFDFDRGVVTYKTTSGSGQRPGFNPPIEFRRFLNADFVNFFVFDGELAQRLLDRSHTNAEAAVETLFQVNTFSVLKQRVKEYWTQQTEKDSATEDRGLSRRENKVANLEARLASLKKSRRELDAKKGALATQLRGQEDAYLLEIKKDETLSENINRATIKAERLKAAVREEASMVLDAMRDPHAVSAVFASAISSLKSGLDRVKLPDSAAREFFNELADEADCVCGRPIDEHVKAAIRSRAAQYLASDDVMFLNSLKTAVSEAVGAAPESAEQILKAKIADLEEIVGEERELINVLDGFRLEAEQSDPAVQRAKEEIDSLKSSLHGVEEELEKFYSKDQQQGTDNTFGIDVLEKRLKDAERKLAEITRTIELKAKRDVLIGILEDAHHRARTAITSEICEQTNQRIQELLPHNSIAIERIDRSLVLENQEGGSVGETLSIAYAFLSTLFNRSEHQLPFVVDSPAGPIDLAVRPKIGDLIPRLTEQFIAFTISSERERFIPRLKAASGHDLQFLTLFRKGPAELQRLARASADCTETADGFIVSGESFFNDFQLDEEVA